MPLVYADIDSEVTIVKVLADEKLKKHLESLGILPNGKIKVLSKANGSVICVLKDGRIALDNSTASKILVA